MTEHRLLSAEDIKILNSHKDFYGEWKLNQTGLYMNELTDFIEEKLMPQQVAHFSFPQPVLQSQAMKLLYRFFQMQVCRPTKQHCHLWLWGDEQPNRTGTYEHFHSLLNYERKIIPPIVLELEWCSFIRGTQESAKVEAYELGRNIIGYSASKHSRWDEFFVCSGGQYRCKNGRDCYWNKHPDEMETFTHK